MKRFKKIDEITEDLMGKEVKLIEIDPYWGRGRVDVGEVGEVINVRQEDFGIGQKIVDIEFPSHPSFTARVSEIAVAVDEKDQKIEMLEEQVEELQRCNTRLKSKHNELTEKLWDFATDHYEPGYYLSEGVVDFLLNKHSVLIEKLEDMEEIIYG